MLVYLMLVYLFGFPWRKTTYEFNGIAEVRPLELAEVRPLGHINYSFHEFSKEPANVQPSGHINYELNNHHVFHIKFVKYIA